MPYPPQPKEEANADSEVENDENAENDPSLSPSPVTFPTLSPRRPTLAKRPLSDLPTPTEPDSGDEGLSPSEQNIAANAAFTPATGSEELRPEMAKLVERSRGVKFASPARNSWQQEIVLAGRSFTEKCEVFGEEEGERPRKRVCSAEGKENLGEAVELPAFLPEHVSVDAAWVLKPLISGTARKASAPAATAAAKAKGRVGLRRL